MKAMGHDHDHGQPGHTHGAPADGAGRAFAVGVTLNAAFVLIEAGWGLWAGSVALLADAAHNLSDVLGLLLAWGASALARRQASVRRTYGLRRSTILAALGNAALLLVAVGGVAWEAVGRLRNPGPVSAKVVIAVAAVGVLINSISALLFLRGGKGDANLRGAFLHLAADAGVSLGVVAAGALMWWGVGPWIDPLTSLLVSAAVLVGTFGLLRDALNLALDAVPGRLELKAVRSYLLGLPGVEDVHDLHVWSLSTTEVALTAHLVMPWSTCPPSFLRDLDRQLRERFAIDHATVQIEPGEAPGDCRLAAPEAICAPPET